jgi:hypothetical protein
MTTYYQPATVAPVVTQPACCATNAAATTFAPVSTSAAPAMGPAMQGPSYPSAPASPTTNGVNQSPSDKTFKQAPEAKESGVNGEATSFPRLTDPMNRTTSTRLPAGAYTPVAWKPVRTAAPSVRLEKLDDSGWEAAR